MQTSGHARRADRWPALDRTLVVTLLFLSFINAAAIWALPRLIDAEAWMLLTFLVVTTVVLNFAYLSRRRWSMPVKYLLPGTVFLLLFQVYPVLYSAYVSTTNLGTGNILNKEAAIRQIELASLSPSVEEGRFRATAVRNDDGDLGLFLIDPAGRELLGTEDELRELEPADIRRDGETVVDVDGYRPLTLREAQDVQRQLSALEIPADEGIIRLQTFNAAALQRYTRVYDPETDTVTDLVTGTVYAPVDGRFTAEDGSRITPGWQTGIGLDNYRRVLTSEAIRGPFLRVFVWNWAFAALSVLFTFVVGLGLAITLNNELMHGQRVYRSLLIIPYALPSFMSALIWQGMLNRDFGIINDLLGVSIPWLTDDWMARVSVLLVNTWLGFPYMFLVATGALQSVPGELREAAEMDGATPWQGFRRITFPLLMIPLAPLLIASFAFNFNNFNVIYLLNRGGPPIVGAQTPAGHTDILISYTYRLAFEGGRGQDLGLAAAISVMIFFMVAAFAAVSFRRTRALEDLVTTLDAPATAPEQPRSTPPSTPQRSRSQSAGRWWRNLGWRHLVGVLAVVFALFPAIYAVSSSLNAAGTLVASGLVPSNPTLSNYTQLFEGDIPYRNWLVNSILIAGGAAVANTMLSALAAYAFSRMRFVGRRAGILTILLVQMFPQALAFVAIFVMIADLGNVFPAIGLGQRSALFLVYLGGAMGVNTWLMKGYFDTIPRSLDESALIDGATHGQIFFRVILPLTTPVLAVVALLTFVFLFNDFVIASAVLGQGDADNFTLAVGLFRFVDNRASRWGLFTAGSVLAAIPIVLLFQFLQRYIVSGLTQGAVKG